MAAPKGHPHYGGGRKKGQQNASTVAAKEAFALAFKGIGGVTALRGWAEENQTEFFKLYARLIPVDVNAGGELTVLLKDLTGRNAET